MTVPTISPLRTNKTPVDYELGNLLKSFSVNKVPGHPIGGAYYIPIAIVFVVVEIIYLHFLL